MSLGAEDATYASRASLGLATVPSSLRNMSDPTSPVALSSKFEVEPEIASLSTTLAYSRQPTSTQHYHSPSPGGTHHPERKAWYKAEHRKQIWERATPTKVAKPVCVVVRYGSVVWHAKVGEETYIYYLKVGCASSCAELTTACHRVPLRAAGWSNRASVSCSTANLGS